MKKLPASESPLERLVRAAQEKAEKEKSAQQMLPIKLEPKNRLEENVSSEILIPTIDENLTLIENTPHPMMVANSFTLNINFNIDNKTVDRAIKTSKKVAKGIAAAGAAMIGTAYLLNNKKVVDKVKIPLMPKIKLPKIKKEKEND